ncbi:MAG: aminotransferase class V-fold PLP-dependent enzyme, partial [Myxococcales bacterium]|nr:aminotransferase class V-fold PLP-dependent enzyme [Myxococcales bacterium]
MIYLDHHAASPVGPHVREAMARAAEVAWANPSSIHAAGRAARRVVDRAREQVANALGAQAPDVVFTAGGTEACNLGVFGLARGKRRVVTTAIEHPAVGKAVAALGARGLEVVELPVVGGTPPPADRIAALGGSD